MDDEFPLDHAVFSVVFPCFMVNGENGDKFAYHPITGGGYVVAVLTDEDSLNSYRHGIELPEHRAVRLRTPAQLLAVLNSLHRE